MEITICFLSCFHRYVIRFIKQVTLLMLIQRIGRCKRRCTAVCLEFFHKLLQKELNSLMCSVHILFCHWSPKRLVQYLFYYQINSKPWVRPLIGRAKTVSAQLVIQISILTIAAWFCFEVLSILSHINLCGWALLIQVWSRYHTYMQYWSISGDI